MQPDGRRSLRDAGAARRLATTYLLFGAVALLVLFPLGWTLLGAFKASDELFTYPPTFWPRHPSLAAITDILTRAEFPRYLWNSLVVSGSTVVLTLALGSLAGYAFSRWSFALKDTLLVVLLTLQLIPSTVNVVPYYMMVSQAGLLNSLAVLILIYTANHIPLTIWIMKGFFDTIPSSMDEAVAIDGGSKLRTFVSIILPLSLPGLSVAGFLVFIAAWAEFLIPLVLAPSREVAVVSVGLYSFFEPEGTPVNSLLAATLVSITPVLVVYLLAQRFLASGLASVAEK